MSNQNTLICWLNICISETWGCGLVASGSPGCSCGRDSEEMTKAGQCHEESADSWAHCSQGGIPGNPDRMQGQPLQAPLRSLEQTGSCVHKAGSRGPCSPCKQSISAHPRQALRPQRWPHRPILWWQERGKVSPVQPIRSEYPFWGRYYFALAFQGRPGPLVPRQP